MQSLGYIQCATGFYHECKLKRRSCIDMCALPSYGTKHPEISILKLLFLICLKQLHPITYWFWMPTTVWSGGIQFCPRDFRRPTYLCKEEIRVSLSFREICCEEKNLQIVTINLSNRSRRTAQSTLLNLRCPHLYCV